MIEIPTSPMTTVSLLDTSEKSNHMSSKYPCIPMFPVVSILTGIN